MQQQQQQQHLQSSTHPNETASTGGSVVSNSSGKAGNNSVGSITSPPIVSTAGNNRKSPNKATSTLAAARLSPPPSSLLLNHNDGNQQQRNKNPQPPPSQPEVLKPNDITGKALDVEREMGQVLALSSTSQYSPTQPRNVASIASFSSTNSTKPRSDTAEDGRGNSSKTHSSASTTSQPSGGGAFADDDEENGVNQDIDGDEDDIDGEEDKEEDAISDFPTTETLSTTSPPAQRTSMPPNVPSPSSNSSSSPSPFPHSASPKLGRALYKSNNNYNEQFPGDITSVNRYNSRNRVTTLGGFDEESDLVPSSAFPSSPLSSSTGIGNATSTAVTTSTSTTTAALGGGRGGTRDDKSTISSIDAFEASFSTNFLDSFSSPLNSSVTAANGTTTKMTSPSGGGGEFRTGSLSGMSSSNDTYNPFSASPQKQTSSLSASKQLYKQGHRGDPPGKNRTSPRTQPLQQQQKQSISNGTKTSMGAFSPGLISTAPTHTSTHHYGSSQRMQRASSIASFQTASVHNATGNGSSNTNGSSSSSTPKKTASPLSSTLATSSTNTTAPASSLMGLTRHRQEQQMQTQPVTPPSSQNAVSSLSSSPANNSYKTPTQPPAPASGVEQQRLDSGGQSGSRTTKQQQLSDSANSASSSNLARLRYEQAIQPSRLQLTNNSPTNKIQSSNKNSNITSANSNLHITKHHLLVPQSSGTAAVVDDEESSSNRRIAAGGDRTQVTAGGADSRSGDSSSLPRDGTLVRTRAEYLLQQHLQQQLQNDDTNASTSALSLQHQLEQKLEEPLQPLSLRRRSTNSPLRSTLSTTPSVGRVSAGGGGSSSRRELLVETQQQQFSGRASPQSSSSSGRHSTTKRDSPFEEKKTDLPTLATSSPRDGSTTNRLTNTISSSSPRDYLKPQQSGRHLTKSLEGRMVVDHSVEEKKSDSGGMAATTLDSPTTVSVKDRVSLFSNRNPRSPEAGNARIHSLSSSPIRNNTVTTSASPSSSPKSTQRQHQHQHQQQYNHVRAGSLESLVAAPRPFMMDAGDIPLVSSIRRNEKESYANSGVNNTKNNTKSSPSFKRLLPWGGDEDPTYSSTITGTSTLKGGGTTSVGEVSSSQ